MEVTAAVLIIGNEILSGRTQDANLGWLGARLNDLGIRLREARVVPDREAVIADAVNALRTTHDYVFTTGGIGPTHDDITAASLATAFGHKLIRHAEAVATLNAHYNRRGLPLTDSRLKMAEAPEGAELVENTVSGAPGFRIENVFVFAGIPSIMQAQFEAAMPSLRRGRPLRSRTIDCAMGEGYLAKGLSNVQDAFPDIDIGSYPYYREGGFGTKLVLRGVDAATLAEAVGRVSAMVEALGATPVEETRPEASADAERGA